MENILWAHQRNHLYTELWRWWEALFSWQWSFWKRYGCMPERYWRRIRIKKSGIFWKFMQILWKTVFIRQISICWPLRRSRAFWRNCPIQKPKRDIMRLFTFSILYRDFVPIIKEWICFWHLATMMTVFLMPINLWAWPRGMRS